MTIADHQLAFEQALRHGNDDTLLMTLLRLIVAVEHALQERMRQIQTIETPDNLDLYHNTIQLLMTRDMLAYVSSASGPETIELRTILDSEAPTLIISWYHRKWSGRVTTAAEIIASIANSLRTAMTVIYGHIDLLRRFTSPNTAQETAYQHIVEAVDMLRACRNQLQNRFVTNGIDIQLF